MPYLSYGSSLHGCLQDFSTVFCLVSLRCSFSTIQNCANATRIESLSSQPKRICVLFWTAAKTASKSKHFSINTKQWAKLQTKRTSFAQFFGIIGKRKITTRLRRRSWWSSTITTEWWVIWREKSNAILKLQKSRRFPSNRSFLWMEALKWTEERRNFGFEVCSIASKGNFGMSEWMKGKTGSQKRLWNTSRTHRTRNWMKKALLPLWKHIIHSKLRGLIGIVLWWLSYVDAFRKLNGSDPSNVRWRRRDWDCRCGLRISSQEHDIKSI